jgi:beta-glucanase (GH16 family)
MPDRKRLLHVLRPVALLAALTVSAPNGRAKGWRLSWGDEFKGRAGAAVDPTKWTRATGGAGWGNRELEFYTDSTENARLDGRGSLVITAISSRLPPPFKCWYGPCLYTSARLVTKDKFSQAYGRFEARIKLPAGQGVWPAFWLLGADIDKVGWPACGEIDIMENIGREPSAVHGTIHGPGYSGERGIGSPYALPQGRRVADGFHVYAVEWEPAAIRWYVDDQLYETRTPADLPAGARWVYDHPFFILLNFAVGGTWPGDPDKTTAFPQTMIVDYVRVFRRA